MTHMVFGSLPTKLSVAFSTVGSFQKDYVAARRGLSALNNKQTLFGGLFSRFSREKDKAARQHYNEALREAQLCRDLSIKEIQESYPRLSDKEILRIGTCDEYISQIIANRQNEGERSSSALTNARTHIEYGVYLFVASALLAVASLPFEFVLTAEALGGATVALAVANTFEFFATKKSIKSFDAKIEKHREKLDRIVLALANKLTDQKKKAAPVAEQQAETSSHTPGLKQAPVELAKASALSRRKGPRTAHRPKGPRSGTQRNVSKLQRT